MGATAAAGTRLRKTAAAGAGVTMGAAGMGAGAAMTPEMLTREAMVKMEENFMLIGFERDECGRG
jgi:hypothetical protein